MGFSRRRRDFMGFPLPSPMSYVRPLVRVMRKLADQFPEEGFDIAAHSIGGVMAREVLRQNPELANCVGRIVTLGSPHHGTAVVRWLKFGPVYRMLALHSDYVENLGTFQTLAPRSAATTVGTLHDLVVYPYETCHLEGSHQVTLERISHLGLMTEERALDEVQKALGASSRSVGKLGRPGVGSGQIN
jgi:pimeloyl-ACP methyl ester carboxylesterase